MVNSKNLESIYFSIMWQFK